MDLHEKPLHRIRSIWCRNHLESNLYVFFSVHFFFLFRINSLSVKNYCCQYYMTLSCLKLDLHGACRIGFTCLDPILYTKFHHQKSYLSIQKSCYQYYMASPICKSGSTWVTLILHCTSRPLKIGSTTTFT